MQTSSIGENIERVESSAHISESPHAKPSFTVDHLRAFRPILSFLNAKDRDILYLVFVSGKKQKHIQEILGRTQPSLCYDIKRIRKRLKFVFYINSVFDVFLDFIFDPPEYLTSHDIELMVVMFYTTSFTMSAEIIGCDMNTRYTYDKILEKLAEHKQWDIYEILMAIRKNLNIVRRECRTNVDGLHRKKDIYIPYD